MAAPARCETGNHIDTVDARRGRVATGPMWYEPAVPGTRPAVAIDVTPLLGARSGIGNAVGEITAALQRLEAAPPLVPYTLSLRARRTRADVPPDTRFVPLPARMLLRS